MDDQATNRASGGSVNRLIKSTPRQRILAGVLSLIYVALFALAGYLESIGAEKYWPTWVQWVAGVTWFAIMMVLPFLVVKYFFGMDLSPLWRPLQRFTLRKMLLGVLYVSVFVWYFTQMHWSIKRGMWRTSNRAAVRSTHGRAPLALRLVGETGESRIEIKNGTKEQIAEARRLFPEATVVAVAEVPDGTQAVPAVTPVAPQPAAENNKIPSTSAPVHP